MTHLVVSEGTLWVIKCGHKFTQNANRTFFFPISIIINGTCLSPWLVTHFKPRAQFSLLGSGWSFRRVLCYFGFSEREADPKAGLNMQEICRGWGETPVSKRAEVQEKGRERLEMAMWARHSLTGEWGGRRDGVKESRTAAHSKKNVSQHNGASRSQSCPREFSRLPQKWHESFIRCAESLAGSSPGEGAVLETEEAVNCGSPWPLFLVARFHRHRQHVCRQWQRERLADHCI